MPKGEIKFEDLDKVFSDQENVEISDDQLLELVKKPKEIAEKTEAEQIAFWKRVAERMNSSESFKKDVYSAIDSILKP